MKVFLDILFAVSFVVLAVVWITTFVCMPIIISMFFSIPLMNAVIGQICLVMFVLIGIVGNQVYNV
jgi:hypothetical protein